MEDVEEDPKIREKINIYKKRRPIQNSISTMDEGDDEIENGPTLAEMLEDLDIDDVEMGEGKWEIVFFVQFIYE